MKIEKFIVVASIVWLVHMLLSAIAGIWELSDPEILRKTAATVTLIYMFVLGAGTAASMVFNCDSKNRKENK